MGSPRASCSRSNLGRRYLPEWSSQWDDGTHRNNNLLDSCLNNNLSCLNHLYNVDFLDNNPTILNNLG